MAVNSSKRFVAEINSPPSLIELGFFSLLFVTTFVAFKFSAEIIGIVSILCLVVAYLKRCQRFFAVWRLLSLIWLASLVVTIDLAVRSGETFSVRWVPVFETGHGGMQVERARANGLVENRDFVVYDRRSFPIPSRTAVLITLPSSGRIQTPTLWFLKAFR
jgi:hypothetical protein